MSEQNESELPSMPMTNTAEPGPPEPGSFAAGYHEGQEDVLYALAAGHRWAVDKLEVHKAKAAKIKEMNAMIDKEKTRLAERARSAP